MSKPQLDPLLVLAEEALHARRERARFFPDALFGESAWDILLELFVAALHGKQVAPADLCATVGSLPSVTARWITVLENNGLVARSHQPSGGADCEALTVRGYLAMRDYLAQLASRHPATAVGVGLDVSGSADAG